MLMPTPTPVVFYPLRSHGAQPLPATARLGYDPAQGAWIDADRPDDILPLDDDPLRAGDDALARRGLTLRPWAPGDVPAFRVPLDDARVWAHLPEPYPNPLDAAGAAGLIALANRWPGQIVRAVVCDGVVLGQVRLDLSPGGGAAELSYWLGRAFWGQGFGGALVAGTVTRAFARLPEVTRLVAKVRPANLASARALRSAGFRPLTRAPLSGFDGWDWLGLRRAA